MQQVRPTKPTLRPIILLFAVAGFLLVYLGGILRAQPLLWISLSSTAALGILLVAGLAIDHLLSRQPETEEPAALYRPPVTRNLDPKQEK